LSQKPYYSIDNRTNSKLNRKGINLFLKEQGYWVHLASCSKLKSYHTLSLRKGKRARDMKKTSYQNECTGNKFF
jgi:hypothetical protein